MRECAEREDVKGRETGTKVRERKLTGIGKRKMALMFKRSKRKKEKKREITRENKRTPPEN